MAAEAMLPEPTSSNAIAQEIAYRICRAGLRTLGVSFKEIAPIRAEAGENPACGIARPLRILKAGPDLKIEGGAVMSCPTALSLALWVRDEAQPAARMLPGAPRITALLPGSTYQCRPRIGDSGLSAHGRGTAFDLMGVVLSDESALMIAPRNGIGAVEEGFQKAARHGACLYFTTVLGPGSNASHTNHLHFDTLARRAVAGCAGRWPAR
ncbi:MAG: extensin family protein [Paracoccus sp. (in: a-proteobacteria)]